MAQAAYSKKVKVGTSGSGPWNDVPATTATLNQGGDILDDTDLATNAGFRSRILGLHDWSVSITANWDASDAALIAIRDAWLNRTELYVQYLPDGQTANGFQGAVVVENFNLSGDVGGLETVEISLQADGALSAAS